MNIYDKFYKKYGNDAVMIPPPGSSPPNEKLDEEGAGIPIDPSNLNDKWTDLLNRDKPGSYDPLTEKPSETEDEILEMLHKEPIHADYEKEILSLLGRDIDNVVQNHEFQAGYSPEGGQGTPVENIGHDAPTKPPPRKNASVADKVADLCDDFAKKAVMLPPATLENLVVKVPSNSIIPDIQEPSEEDLDFILEMQKLKQKKYLERKNKQNEEMSLLQRIENSETVRASKTPDELVRLSSQYYDLCSK